MNNGDSDKTIQHDSSDKTIGHEPAPSHQPSAPDKPESSTTDSNRTHGGEQTVMFSSSGGGKGTGSGSDRDTSKRLIPDVANYEIIGELGRGGMGVVYKARNRELNRVVALKMILSGAHASEETIQRFRTEAEAVAQLQHPNIVQVFDVGQSAGQPWCALEFVDGGGLDQFLESRELGERESAHLVEQLARAMQSAHVAGIVHRDLKPANILLAKPSDSSIDHRATQSLFPKITDFGLAKRVEQNASHTQTGAIVGTPSYMSPEQARGLSRIGPSADIYALGAILYRLLTGRPPFAAETPIKTVMQVISDEPTAPASIRASVDRDLATICMKCLEKDPGRRYPSAEHLAQDLARYSSGEPILARPVSAIERTGKWIRRKPWAAAVISLAALGLLGTIVGGAVFNTQLSNAYNEVQKEQQKAVLALEAENVAKEEAVAAGQLAEKNAEESQRRLVDNYVNNGLQALEQNQPLFALPWFAEAIKIDRDPTRNRIHTMRFEAARQRSPQVLDTWLTDSAVSNVKLNRQGTLAVASTGSRKIVMRDVVNNTTISEREIESPVVYLDADEDLTTLVTVVVRLNEGVADFQHQLFDICCLDGSTLERIGTGVRLPFDFEASGLDHAISLPVRVLAHVDGQDRTVVKLLDIVEGNDIATLNAHGPIRFILFNPTGSHLVVVSDRIQLWNVADRKWTWESEFESNTIEKSQVALGDDVLVFHNNQIQAIELESGQTLSEFKPLDTPISISVSPDGSRIFCASRGGRVEVRNISGQLVHSLELSSQASDFVFRKNAEVMLIATSSQIIRVDLESGQQLGSPIPATVLPLNSLYLDESGSRIVTGGGHGIYAAQGVMRVWSCDPAIHSHPVAATDESGIVKLASTVLSPDGKLLAGYARDSSFVRVFRINEQPSGGAPTSPGAIDHWLTPLDFESSDGETATPVSRVVFSPDSDSLLVCHQDGSAEIRSLPSGTTTSRFQSTTPISSAKFSANGQFVAIAAGEEQTGISVFNVADGVPAGPVLECPRLIYEFAFTADNQSLVTVSKDLSIRCWDLGTFKVRWKQSVDLLINNVAIDVSGDRLAISGGRLGGMPGRLELLRLSTGEELISPVDFGNEVSRVDIFPSSELMLICLANGTVETRSLSDGQPAGRAVNHPDRVLQATLRDDELLLTVCRDQRIRIFDRNTGLLITSWDFSGSNVSRANFVANRPLLVVDGQQATLCELPDSSLKREEVVNAAVFISATEISDQGLIRPAPSSRMAAAAGDGSAIEIGHAQLPAVSVGNDAMEAFYSNLSPEMKDKFPNLPVPVASTGPLLLKFKFSPGQQRRYRFLSNTELNTMGVDSVQAQDEVLKCVCDELTDDRFRVTVEHEHYVSTLNTPGGSYLVDKANPERNRAAPAFLPIMEIFKVAHSAPSSYEVEPNGTIPDYLPPPEMTAAIEASPQAQSMSISAKSLATNHVSMWTNLPDHPVETGDQWPAIVVVSIFAPEEIDATATFLGVASIEDRSLGVIRIEAIAAGRPYAGEIFGDMKSRSDSLVYFDLDAGCIDQVFTSSVANMDLNINNTSIQQTIDGRIEIRRLEKAPE